MESVISAQNIHIEQRQSGRLSIVGEDDVHSDLVAIAALTADKDGNESDDTDLVTESDKPRNDKRSTHFESAGKNIYISACRIYNQVPASYFLRWEECEELKMKHHSLGPMGIKAICVSLVSNTTIEVLDLDDNGMETQGCFYVADMLRENYFISDLTLSNNSIGPSGAITLFNVIARSDSLIKLDISGNKIGDGAAKAISEALIENGRITDLNLSCNSLGERAGEEFGKMLQMNSKLLRLDVSSNSLRTNGAVLFFHGLKKNLGLVYLNFGNNGVGMEACAELSKVVKENQVIEEIEVANNRIPLAGTVLLARALKFNTTLKYLDLSRNTFMAPGCLVLLEMLSKTTTTALRFLNFGTILVTKEFGDMQEKLEAEMHILIKQGGILESWRYGTTKTYEVNLREALCFLTNYECQQLAKCLGKLQNPSTDEKTTIKTLGKAVNECGWETRCPEIMKRAEKAMKHSLIEYSSLLIKEEDK